MARLNSLIFYLFALIAIINAVKFHDFENPIVVLNPAFHSANTFLP